MHQQTEIRVGCLADKFKELHYNDWRSLFAMDAEKVLELIPDKTLRKKFTDLVGDMPKSEYM